jgi:hypothetical protein
MYKIATPSVLCYPVQTEALRPADSPYKLVYIFLFALCTVSMYNNFIGLIGISSKRSVVLLQSSSSSNFPGCDQLNFILAKSHKNKGHGVASESNTGFRVGSWRSIHLQAKW